MQEAKEAAKLKIKQIEMQKREAKKLAAATKMSTYPEPQKVVDKSSSAINITSASSSFKRSSISSNARVGKGMKLGKK